MKTVKIVNGVYAHRVNGRTVPVGLGGTCEVDDGEAARLEDLKVAVCMEEAAAPVQGPEPVGEPEPPRKAKKPGRGRKEEAPPDFAPEEPVA